LFNHESRGIQPVVDLPFSCACAGTTPAAVNARPHNKATTLFIKTP
jgi:hypothetical protein